ncbi:MAG: PDZ domain-containing protein, partial [Syntrophorhabdaceae bacterium]|nr:PDZ domain-containing protein [Syntrophorhabdaceae bacterium]
IARHFKLKDTRGVIVTEVQPGSPAYEADIREGDIIIKIGKRTIKNVNDFKEAMKKANIKEGIVIFLRRENMTFYTVMREE